MSEKNSAQTNKQTDRRYENNSHLAVNQNFHSSAPLSSVRSLSECNTSDQTKNSHISTAWMVLFVYLLRIVADMHGRIAWMTMKDAGNPKSSKTDGRALLDNSGSLRNSDKKAANEDAKDADKDAGTAADADAKSGDSKADNNNNAVAASGYVIVADYTDKVAANEFFTPGRIFAARVKHSSFPGELCRVFRRTLNAK